MLQATLAGGVVLSAGRNAWCTQPVSGSVVLSAGRNACRTQPLSGSGVHSAGREYGPGRTGRERKAGLVRCTVLPQIGYGRLGYGICYGCVGYGSVMCALGIELDMGASGMESAMGACGMELAMGALGMEWKRIACCTQPSSGSVVLSSIRSASTR